MDRFAAGGYPWWLRTIGDWGDYNAAQMAWSDLATVITEVAVCGFWKYYCKLMHVPVAPQTQAAE